MNIEELLSEARIPFLREGHHHCRPGWIQLDCPLCGKDSRKYHLGFNVSASYFNCWKCGSLRIDRVLSEFGLRWDSIRSLLSRLEKTDSSPVRKAVAGKLKEPAGRERLGKPHKRYLRSRGFDPEELQKVWQLEGIGIAARLSWRIYIPVTRDLVRVSFTTRSIGENASLRYISASPEEEAIYHKHLVYGLDYCHHSVVVVEGPSDAWRIGPGAGATFGTSYSTAQVKQLARIPYRFICFDNEPAAQLRAQQLAEQLSCFPGDTTILELDAADPGSMKPREVRQVRRAARL